MRRMTALLCLGAALALAGCGDDGRGSGTDAGRDDAGRDDAGRDASTDAGRDAGGEDAGAADAGGDDAGTDAATPDDAGAEDAGAEDAGAGDAGAGGFDCSTARLVTGDVTIDDSTIDSGDDFAPDGDGCPAGAAATGNDRVYELSANATTAGTWTVTVTPDGAAFDPMLYTRGACDDVNCVDGTVLNGPGTMEQLDVELADGESIWVIVDGELFTSGDYTLVVDAP